MKVGTLEAQEQRLEGTSKRPRHQNLSLQKVSGKKRAESLIQGVSTWRRRFFSSGQGCRHQEHSVKGRKAVTAESQRQAIPALPILVTAAMGEIAALTAVIPYKKRHMWTWIKQRLQSIPYLPTALGVCQVLSLPIPRTVRWGTFLSLPDATQEMRISQ